MPGEHIGERTPEPCVRTHLSMRGCCRSRVVAVVSVDIRVPLYHLRADVRLEAGGDLCRLKGRHPAQNRESGRERPLRNAALAAWLSASRGRSRPDLTQSLPHEVGLRRTRLSPQSSAPFTDITARLCEPCATSIAIRRIPSWH